MVKCIILTLNGRERGRGRGEREREREREERERERERDCTPAACWLMILEIENSPSSSIPWKLSSSSAPTERISASGTILGDSIVTPSAEEVRQ